MGDGLGLDRVAPIGGAKVWAARIEALAVRLGQSLALFLAGRKTRPPSAPPNDIHR